MGFLSLIRASATSESLEIRSTRSKIHDLILRYQAIQKPVADLNVPTLEKTIIKMLHMLDLCMKSNGNNDSVIKFVSLLTNLIDSILDPIIKAIPRNGVVFSNWATAGLHVLSRELNDAIPPKRQLVGTIFSRIFYTVDVGGTLPDVNRRIEEALNRFWINLGGNGLNPSIYNSSRELIPDRETQDLPIDALMIRALFQNFGPPFRILIIGRANSGKTTILRNFFGTSDPLVVRDKNGNEIDRLYLENQSIMGSMHDIEHEITSQSNPLFVIHDSKGFEAGSTQEMQKVRDFIRQRSVASCIHRRLHVIWYCIPMDEDRILSPAELSFFNDGTRDVPVIALFTKWDGQIVQSFHEIYNRGNGGKTIGEAREEAACHAEDVLKSHYLPAIYRTLHPPKGHVVLKGDMREPETTYDDLLKETVRVIAGQKYPRPTVYQRKYALLIGIAKYEDNTRWPDNPGAQNDLRLYKKILKDTFEFSDTEIVVLSDEADPSSEWYPSRDNIVREIRKLGRSVQKGELGFFVFSGHGTQLPISEQGSNNSELDGLDEAIVPIDDQPAKRTYIIDNDLNEWLVASLPAGAVMLAVFDCSASETLLDLPFRYVLLRDGDQLQVRTEPAHLTNKGGAGNVLCISACKDDQRAPNVRNVSTGEYFGALTALLYRLVMHGTSSNGDSNSLMLSPPDIQQILTELSWFFEGHGNSAMVQITSSRPVLA